MVRRAEQQPGPIGVGQFYADVRAQLPPRLEQPHAITGVTVVPMDSNRSLSAHTVVIDKGRITALGPDREVVIPHQATTLDGRGRWLMPGLADMHTHYSDAGQFCMFLANGITQVRNMWGGPVHLKIQRMMARGEHPGPWVFTTGPITEGGPTYPGVDIVTDPKQAAAVVARRRARGYQALKVYSNLRRDTLRALCAAAQAVGWEAYGHCPSSMTVEEGMEAGMNSMEHLIHWDEVLSKHGLDGARRLAELTATAGVWNCPTLSVFARIADDPVQAESDPAFRCVPRVGREQWLRRSGAARWVPERRDAGRARLEALCQVVGVLHEAGAPLILGTDSGSPMTVQGFTMLEELELMAAAGLGPYAVLAMGTVDAARSLHQEDDWGQVAVGMRADLLLLDADPLRDVRALSRLSVVISNGFLFDRARLDALIAWRRQTVDRTVHLPAAELSPMANRRWWARR